MRRPLIAGVAALAVAVLLPASAISGVSEHVAVYVAPPGACLGDSAIGAPPASEQETMACLVNWARVKRGMRPLRLSVKLRAAAELKIADELRCNDFSHTPCGVPFLSIFQRSGYVASSVRMWAVGENLAWGQGDLSSPRATITAWLNSPHHRANLFDPRWTDLGIGYRPPTGFLGYESVALWVNEFGTHA